MFLINGKNYKFSKIYESMYLLLYEPVILYSSENRKTKANRLNKMFWATEARDSLIRVHVNIKRPKNVFLTCSLFLTADFKKPSSVV